MNSFTKGLIEQQSITQELLQTIRLIGEYKGKQDLYKVQSPQVLETLRQVAVVQSTESSNRIEGIIVSADRIKKLIQERTTPRDRSEQEITGYRQVLDVIQSLPGEFAIADLQEQCPTVSIDHIRRILQSERKAGRLKCLGKGADARWQKK